MTPTEQDKLRELVHIVQNADTTYDAIKFITSDRKRVALEARIDEVNQLYNEHLRRWDDDECDIYINRIAELEAQQEEV